MDDEREALDRSVSYARRLGLPHREASLLAWLGASRFHGTTPLLDVIAWSDEQVAAGFNVPGIEVNRGLALAMLGQFDEARARSKAIQEELEGRGASVPLSLTLAIQAPEIERLAGDPARALEFSKLGCAMLEEAGERSWLSTAVGFAGQASYELGDLDNALEAANRAAELGASDDAITQMVVRQVRAKVLARRGDLEQAERLVREAIELGEAVDMPCGTGEAYEDLGHVLYLAGKTVEAEQAIERAIEIYDAKGAVAMSDRARRALATADA
jgi:tetratricopeptide (TPR) repeat protein